MPSLNAWKWLLFLLLFTAVESPLFCQKKSLAIELANKAYESADYKSAIRLFDQCPVDSISGGDLHKLADCYWQTRDYDNALIALKKLSADDVDELTSTERFRLGTIYARIGNLEEASSLLEKIEGYRDKENSYTNKIEGFQIDSMAWKVNSININTPYREFAPLIYKNKLLFSSNRPVKSGQRTFGWDGEFYSRIWQTTLDKIKVGDVKFIDMAKVESKHKRVAGFFEGADTRPTGNLIRKYVKPRFSKELQDLPGDILEGMNSVKYNIAGVVIDKYDTIYFASNYSDPNKKGEHFLHLMQGVYTEAGVTKIEPMPFGDETYNVMHPAITNNGRLLVFSSDKKGGVGQCDLYYSIRSNLTQKWGAPILIKGNVNTIGNEVFPFLAEDGYLYYSSDGMQGLGGLDIYRIKIINMLSGKGIPEHMPYPVNTSSDDFGWTQSEDGELMYMVSDRNHNEDNIYSVQYDREIAKRISIANMHRFYQGYVYDRQTMQPISGAKIFLLNKKEQKVYVALTNQKGKYKFQVSNRSGIVVVGAADGYNADRVRDTIFNDTTSPERYQAATLPLLLDRFVVGYVWKLNNIHYDFNKWNIRADARPILDSVVRVLKKYPIKIELGSHTDSRGSFLYNDLLSQKRAESAVAYIVSQGIAADRIVAKGYGERQLLNRCSDGVSCLESEHEENRRTEVKVLSSAGSNSVMGFDYTPFKSNQVYEANLFPEGFFELHP